MRMFVLIVLLVSMRSWAQYDSWNVTEVAHWADGPQQGWYGTNTYNEVWGFEYNGQEYGIIGSADGTNVIKIGADTLERIQFIQERYLMAIHRDYHDYQGYLYSVCDEGNSTLRIFDMQYLPDSLHIVYDDSLLIERCHNIFIDNSSGLLYACGVTYGTFDSPLRVLSLDNPEAPTLVYDYEFVDYVHDIYVRNDTAFLNAAFQGLRVVDFSNPTMPLPLGSLEFYPDKGYNHSGWLSEDGKTYVMCDETEAMRFKVLDVSDLSDIQVKGLAKPETFYRTLPHNVMLKDGIAYFSYYNDGLQIFDVRQPEDINLLGYYDTYYADTVNYRGAWGVYTELPSERILVSDRSNGLFLLDFVAPPDVTSSEFEYSLFPNVVTEGYTYFYKDHKGLANYQLEIYDSKGSLITVLDGDTDYLRINTLDYQAGIYLFRYVSKNSELVGVGKFIVQNL